MAFSYAEGIPHGKIVPMFLSDDGEHKDLPFHSMEEIELIGELVAGLLGNKVAIDVKNPLNNDKLIIYDNTKLGKQKPKKGG